MSDLSGENQAFTIKKKVDESWKSSVEKEKLSEPAATRPETGKAQASNFVFFLSSLATQALAALGETADSDGGGEDFSGPPADLGQAKYLIDILQMLSEKTHGNLTPQEQAALQNLLYELQLKFVQKSKTPQTL